MAIGGYIRVSSAAQRDNSDSPASQRQRLQAAGATLLFEDLAVSGFRLEDRRRAAGFQRLWEAIGMHRISRLLTVRLDRIARRDQIVLDLAEHCERHGVQFEALGSGAVDASTASGWLSVKMQLLIAEHFSRQLSENIRGGYQGLHAQGIPARAASSLPFHLQRQLGTRHGVIPSPAWDAARHAIEMIIAGRWSVPQAQRHLWTTHGVHRRPETTRAWLRSPALLGHMARHDGTIILRDVWPALISQEDHASLMLALQSSRRRSAVMAAARTPRALSGLCRCGLCGGSMAYHVAFRGEKRYSYIRCWNLECRRKNHSALAVEHAILALLPERLDAIIHSRTAEICKPLPEVKAWMAELQAREMIPEAFRRDADRERINELQQLIAAGRSIGGPDAETIVRLSLECLDVTRWFRRPEVDRNADLRTALGMVTVTDGLPSIS